MLDGKVSIYCLSVHQQIYAFGFSVTVQWNSLKLGTEVCTVQGIPGISRNKRYGFPGLENYGILFLLLECQGISQNESTARAKTISES